MSQTTTGPPPSPAREVPETFPRKSGRMSYLGQLFSSPVSLKWIMALSGIAGLGFILVHMIGNLHLYEGPEQVNFYAESLRTLGGHLAPRGGVLWLMRVGLIVALAVHLYAATRITLTNRKARPTHYASKRDYITANFASRTILLSGIWIGVFILFHLADLTWGRANPDFESGDAYNNVVSSFERPAVAIFYVLSMGILSLHIFHGAWSIFQSLGINNPRYNSWRRGFAVAFAAVILVGNVSFPVMVQLGVISQDDRCWPTQESVELAQHEGFSAGEIETQVADAEAQGICVFEEQQAEEQPTGVVPTDEGGEG